MSSSNIISCINPLRPGPNETSSPFLFCVYHLDQYPAGNDKMEAPKRGNGADFDPRAPYRMYHGDRVPGFPSHPHRGFETVTVTLSGITDHTDSLGNAGRYGFGDLQWMTAGKGIQHGENFPLINRTSDNPFKLFQIWLNLPKASKMVEPCFVMHWAENITKIHSTTTGAGTPIAADGGGADAAVAVTVFAGELPLPKGFTTSPLARSTQPAAFASTATANGSSNSGNITVAKLNQVPPNAAVVRGNPPPPNSYASDPENDVGIYLVQLQPGARYVLPGAKGGSQINRTLYFVEGRSITVGGKAITSHSVVTVNADKDVEIVNSSSGGSALPADVLVLQGKPIPEPVAQHGPFVMNTTAEIQQAFADYRKTEFGGWPWDSHAVIFPRDKGRFALNAGKEEIPPAFSTSGSGSGLSSA